MPHQVALKITGFKPVVGKKPVVLILGSMPSVASLERREYYGNPGNHFWARAGPVCGQFRMLPDAGRENIMRLISGQLRRSLRFHGKSPTSRASRQ